MTLFGPSGSRAPAFLAAAVAAIIAFVYSRRHWPDLPTAGPTQRVAVFVTAVWAFGIVVITAGLIGFQGNGADNARAGLVLVGLGLVAAGLFVERRRRHAGQSGLHIQRRAVADRPLRRVRRRLCPDRGPVPGPGLLPADPRLRPDPVGDRDDPVHGRAGRRRAGGAGSCSSPGSHHGPCSSAGSWPSDSAASSSPPSCGRAAGYVGFAISFALIGAGFVIATTVRTAIIFASVPRGLPATAAALNEASVALGSRAGLVVVTVLVTALALDSYAASLVGQPPGQIDAAVGAFRTLLSAINMPTYRRPHRRGRAERRRRPTAPPTPTRSERSCSVPASCALLAAPIAWLAHRPA